MAVASVIEEFVLFYGSQTNVSGEATELDNIDERYSNVEYLDDNQLLGVGSRALAKFCLMHRLYIYIYIYSGRL